MRIVHVSDIHLWRYVADPRKLLGKRLWGMGLLLAGRARKFRLERLDAVVSRVLALKPDHILITGDLTTTALASEFEDARSRLGPWLAEPERVTVLPGNHDRYTPDAVRDRRFEAYFGEFSPLPTYPWLRQLDAETAILGLDPTRYALTARGKLPAGQLEAARALLSERPRASRRRLIVACHYPLDAPLEHRASLRPKRLLGADVVARWLGGIGPHIYCCGHVHAAWCFAPPAIPEQVCLNAGAPLLRPGKGGQLPGFLEIFLDGGDVTVRHHAWDGRGWVERILHRAGSFS